MPASTDIVAIVGRYLLDPCLHAPWDDWRGFWLGKVFDDRFIVIYFFPLIVLLRCVPLSRLRQAIVLASLLFMAYVFGVLYAGLWLATCVAFHRLGERFAIECRRTDVWRHGPTLAAAAIVGGWYVVTMLLHKVKLPADLNAWLFEHLPWIFPLGARGLRSQPFLWEPFFPRLHPAPSSEQPFQLITALFWDVHIVGTAYLAVRMLHYLAEIRRQTLPVEQRTLLNFLAYVCYGPAVIQGPIERFADFHQQLDTCHQRRTLGDLGVGLYRIGRGVFKSLVVTLYFHPLFAEAFGLGSNDRLWRHPEQIESFWLLYFSVFLIIFSLYLEFSGYCDVAIGMSRLLGYRQIENFRLPWRAVSLRDFWRRWHISLSFLLRDYVYIPLGGNRRHTLRNLLITFFLIGIWHRLMPQVAIWGLLMGLMVWINQRWANWIRQLEVRPTGVLPNLLRTARRLRPLPQIASWLLTQHAFVFSLLVFFGGSGGLNVARELLRRISAWLA